MDQIILNQHRVLDRRRYHVSSLGARGRPRSCGSLAGPVSVKPMLAARTIEMLHTKYPQHADILPSHLSAISFQRKQPSSTGLCPDVEGSCITDHKKQMTASKSMQLQPSPRSGIIPSLLPDRSAAAFLGFFAEESSQSSLALPLLLSTGLMKLPTKNETNF